VIELQQRLDELEHRSLRRRTRLVTGPQGPHVELDGRRVLLLCSNNYLGLAGHPRVREAAAAAALEWGVGAGAARLVSGTMVPHQELEERLAAFKGTEAALLFGSGYLANIGVLSALAGEGDLVLSDELNHASIIDGCRLSRAEIAVYRHCDAAHLEWILDRTERSRGTVIVTDSVFSMDGDIAPLGEIAEIAQRHGARLVVDEAHATGTVGPDGRGAVAAAGLAGQVDVVVGTLGKALGSYGAFAACSRTMADYLLNTARSFIFSTALPVPAVAAATAALTLIETEPQLVSSLADAAGTLRAALGRHGLDTGESTTQIMPVIVGEADVATRVSERVLQAGVFAQVIRPPTVPEGTSRLRLAVMAGHTAEDLERAASVIATAVRACGVPSLSS
jgi:glycine C-acetyltransferase/8-amino-7-oxononanoate synthase